jgi:predicted nuclease of restriction endonuclease-like (RecB) superfamily
VAASRKSPSKPTRALARPPIAQASLAQSPKDTQRGDVRLVLGRARGNEALFPVPPPVAGLPRSYARTLRDIKERIGTARLSTVIAANSAAILLYWEIGNVVAARMDAEQWGAKVIDRLAADIRTAYPDMSGFSSRNLRYMRSFATTWTSRPILQQLAAKLPWGHHMVLLDALDDQATRCWYAAQAIEHGWSRSILGLQIGRKAHARHGRAANNFKQTLPPSVSDFAAQVFKDPYLFDFLGTADPRREQEVELSLVAHIEKFLLELGAGFAFVGRQVPLEVGDKDLRIDLLFYHLKLRRFVVVELKSVDFEPSFVGQLNVYLSAVDDLLKHPDDLPTIGLLLCKTKDQTFVEYALRGIDKPMGVAAWETHLVEVLPKDLEGSLPTIAQIEAELARPAMDAGKARKQAPGRQKGKRR